MLYLDASVIVPLLVPEPRSDVVVAWFTKQNVGFCSGRLALGETASAISRKQREARLTSDEAREALDTLDGWVRRRVVLVEHEPQDIAAAAMLVRRPLPKLLMPDAIHIATSRRLRHRLVTADARLIPVLDLHGIDWTTPD